MSALKNFLITLAISAVIFGLIGFFSTGFITGIVNGILEDDGEGYSDKSSENGGDKNKGDTGDGYDGEIPDGENFTYLFVGTDYDSEKYDSYFQKEEDLKKSVEELKKKEEVGILKDGIKYINATWIVLLRVDKDAHDVVFTYISPETEITSESGKTTLGVAYGVYGINKTCEYISYLTGLTVDGYVIADGGKIGDIIEQFGSATFNLPCDIYSYNDGYTTLSAHNGDVKKTEEKKDDKKKETDSLDYMLETTVEYEKIDNEKVLDKADNSYLSDYSIEILNLLKEYSAGDVTLKGNITVDILKGILTRCVSDWTADDLVWKVNEVTEKTAYTSDDPYEEKTLIATNIDENGLRNFHSMMQAISYFEVKNTVYPGIYISADAEDTAGVYRPDVDEAIETFSEYK